MFHEKIDDIDFRLPGKVAIKLHMGERGNKTHVSPEDVKVLVDSIESSGGEAFLFDTTTLYQRARYTAKGYKKVARENGFGEFNVVIGRDDNYVEVNGFQIPVELTEADSMLVLSHAKGHIFTAFGGAVKNLGMGCVNKNGKRKIHGANRPAYNIGVCLKCGACLEACENKMLVLSEEGIKFLENCSGCEKCVDACKQGALTTSHANTMKSFELFSAAAKAALSLFGKNTFCINVAKRITKFCDCADDAGPMVCKDIGYFAGSNPLAVDMETVAAIKKASPGAFDFKRWQLFAGQAEKYF
jgi:uncharacterized Fe-S center protein